MRSAGSVQLEAWAAARGGVRAAARELGVAASTLSRWIGGAQTPRGDGDLGPAWLEERTGVEAAAWDTMAASPPRPPSPRAAAGAGRGRRGAAPPGEALPPSRTPRPRRAPPQAPARAAVAPAGHPTATTSPPAAPAVEVEDEPMPPPATLPELQARARQIPGELQQLRRSIASGAVKVAAGEVMARMLEREQRAVTGAITAAGTATVEEVEALHALVLSVTRGCEGCRARVTEALRGSAA
ncbi:hypothetical protein ACSRUE_01495 [Sorangium sp. KYC3313]|uniref:hypothetical protein n=1 Tax=Sorangium sp. KYC3313 TaxID=3449740 RepID=UPI003F8C7D88